MMTIILPDEWAKRAYRQLCYAFMERGTSDWYLWSGGWHAIETAPAEVVPPLPVEPCWAILPTWARWWAIDGDGSIWAFYFKPMGWARSRRWGMGAHPPMPPGAPAEMRLGSLGEPVTDWYMTLRRRPAHIEGAQPVAAVKTKAKRKKKELT